MRAPRSIGMPALGEPTVLAIAIAGVAVSLAACGSSGETGGPSLASATDSGAGGDAAMTQEDAAVDVAIDADAGPDDASSDLPDVDATPDVITDAADSDLEDGGVLDAGPDGPTGPPVCGDGWRDPSTEECDDGTGSTPPDSCSADCRVQELPVLLPSSLPAKRRLGIGRHPISAGPSGFAVAYVDYVQTPVKVALRAFGAKGEPIGSEVTLDSGATALNNADPVVAALPNGKFAAVWTDLNGAGDGDGWGITLSIVDPSVGAAGAKVRVNSTTAQNQHSPDVVWTGTELVVAWEDQSKQLTSKSDLRVRSFDAAGKPTSAEQLLAGTGAQELRACLAARSTGGWAAAWRTGDINGDTVRVAENGKQWPIGPVAWAPDGEAPALTELDANHLFVVFLEGGLVSGASRLRGAVIDTSESSPPGVFPIDPLEPAHAADPSLDQQQPSIARVGDRVYLAWRSAAITASPQAQELWLKEITWQSAGGVVTLDLSEREIALPRWPEHRKGDQRWPALVAAPLWPEGALATAWTDFGATFGSGEGKPDVIVEFIPAPVTRLYADGGMGE